MIMKSLKCITIFILFNSVLSSSYAASTTNSFNRTPTEISNNCAAYIEVFSTAIEKLVGDESKASYDSVFETLDNHMVDFIDKLLHDYLAQNVHPDENIRKASTSCSLKGFELLNGLNANRPLYDRMSLVATDPLPTEKAFTVNYWKEQFEQSGIGKDTGTRDKIKALNNEIDKISNKYRQNITDAVLSIVVEKDRLQGLPEDYLVSHPAN
jgi:Zn-dependent oligopeptidase